MKTLTLTNDFHNSSATLRLSADNKATKSQNYRAARKLCGVSGCTCGGNFGERGRQQFEDYITYDDGSARFFFAH